MAWWIWDSTRPPSSMTRDETPLRSLSNWVERCLSGMLHSSTETACDVVFCFFAGGLEEHLFCLAELDQIAQVHVGGVVAAACRLLHVVGHDDHGVVVLQFGDQLFHLGGGDRIERRAGLVKQQHLGLDGDATGDAQTLLLAARQAGTALVELVLHLGPECRLAYGPFDAIVHVGGA